MTQSTDITFLKLFGIDPEFSPNVLNDMCRWFEEVFFGIVTYKAHRTGGCGVGGCFCTPGISFTSHTTNDLNRMLALLEMTSEDKPWEASVRDKDYPTKEDIEKQTRLHARTARQGARFDFRGSCMLSIFNLSKKLDKICYMDIETNLIKNLATSLTKYGTDKETNLPWIRLWIQEDLNFLVTDGLLTHSFVTPVEDNYTITPSGVDFAIALIKTP